MKLWPFGPWRRIRDLRIELERMECSRDGWRHRALLSQDRYDKLHETNVALRDALTLYRNGE